MKKVGRALPSKSFILYQTIDFTECIFFIVCRRSVSQICCILNERLDRSKLKNALSHVFIGAVIGKVENCVFFPVLQVGARYNRIKRKSQNLSNYHFISV